MATNSVCIIGKIQHGRAAMCQIVQVAVDNTVCDLVVESSLPEIGKTGWNYLPVLSNNTANNRQQTQDNILYRLRVTGHNHNLHFINNFRLVNLEVTLVSNGVR